MKINILLTVFVIAICVNKSHSYYDVYVDNDENVQQNNDYFENVNNDEFNQNYYPYGDEFDTENNGPPTPNKAPMPNPPAQGPPNGASRPNGGVPPPPGPPNGANRPNGGAPPPQGLPNGANRPNGVPPPPQGLGPRNGNGAPTNGQRPPLPGNPIATNPNPQAKPGCPQCACNAKPKAIPCIPRPNYRRRSMMRPMMSPMFMPYPIIFGMPMFMPMSMGYGMAYGDQSNENEEMQQDHYGNNYQADNNDMFIEEEEFDDTPYADSISKGFKYCDEIGIDVSDFESDFLEELYDGFTSYDSDAYSTYGNDYGNGYYHYGQQDYQE